jgi:hypothetical protein
MAGMSLAGRRPGTLEEGASGWSKPGEPPTLTEQLPWGNTNRLRYFRLPDIHPYARSAIVATGLLRSM